MKKTILESAFLTAVILTPPAAFGQTSSRNYIKIRTMRDSLSSQFNETVRYYDGLGRLEETVDVGITPQHNSLVSYIGRDAAGRATETFLPVIGAAGPEFLPKAEVTALCEPTYGDNAAFAQTVYDGSPLGLVDREYGPGNDWHTNGKAVKTTRLSNIDGDKTLNCRRYTVSDTRSMTSDDIAIENTGNYSSGTLFVTKTEDEDGNILLTFTDLQGKTLLERRGNRVLLNDTYYIYDDYEQLTAILSPELSGAMKDRKRWTLNSYDKMQDFATMYMYDDRGLCRAKKMPGNDWVYYLYDRAGRTLATKDYAFSSLGNLWRVTIPDCFGRPVITALGYCGYDAIKDKTPDILIMAEKNENGYYTLREEGTEMTLGDKLVFNIYDDYKCIASYAQSALLWNDYTFVAEDGFGTMCATAAHGQLTLAMTSILESQSTFPSLRFIGTVYYYDDMGRLLQTRAQNHLGGTDVTTFDYDFTGNIIKKHSTSTVDNNGTALVVDDSFYRFSYDHAGRLTAISLDNNGTGEKVIQENVYDELGRLVSSSMPGNAGTVGYTYNLRGWVTSISDNRSFRQRIYHNDPPQNDNTAAFPCYNGFVSRMEWSAGDGRTHPINTIERAYNYDYDMGMLATASYSDNIAAERFSSVYQYDRNGNMNCFLRIGALDYNIGHPEATYYGTIDFVYMNYKGDRLIKATEGAENPSNFYETMHFVDGSNQNIEYTYDGNGNMTSDLNKGISLIEYNLLDLPRKIVFADGHVISHTYAADGRKLASEYSYSPAAVARNSVDGSGLTGEDCDTIPGADRIMSDASRRDYLTDCVLANGKHDYTVTPAGYIHSGMHFAMLRDYLGNVRSVIREDGLVIERNHYYPFGTLFFDPLELAGDDSQRYKFGGKELERENALNLMDFHARIYDPLLGRFISPDPLREKFPWISAYAYALNNPVNAIDNDGRVVIFINGQHGGSGGSSEYWEGLDQRVMNHIGDHNALYIDGALGGWKNTICGVGSSKMNLSAYNRFMSGYNKGIKQAESIYRNLSDDESIKIVTHSMGAAYGKGFAYALLMYNKSLPTKERLNKPIEFEVDLAPFQPDKQKAVPGVPTYVLQHHLDGIAGTDKMENATQQNVTRKKSFFNLGLNTLLILNPRFGVPLFLGISLHEHSVNSFTDKEIREFLPINNN